MNAVVKADSPGTIMETVLIKGDLSKLTPDERNVYYFRLCESVGLNPLTQPIEYINLNGKLRLYAKKDCTDQLRSIHKVSVTDMTENEREGVYIVKSKVQNGEGRTDMAIGAVNIAGLKGEALANAMMKAETKSKRRATLSICGLGLLDETEVDDIPAAQKAPVPSAPIITTIADDSKPVAPHKITGGTYGSWTDNFVTAIGTAGDTGTVYAWVDANAAQLERLGKGSPDDAARARSMTDKHLQFLSKTEPKTDPITSGPQGEPNADIGGDVATKVDKPPRGRPKASKAPDLAKDYDGWLSWYLKKIAEAETPEIIEALFEEIDTRWDDLMPPDKDGLLGARRDAEARLEQ